MSSNLDRKACAGRSGTDERSWKSRGFELVRKDAGSRASCIMKDTCRSGAK